MTKNPDFPHRKNGDDTFDAICPKCFQTISNQKVESDLRKQEESHTCQHGSLGNRQ